VTVCNLLVVGGEQIVIKKWAHSRKFSQSIFDEWPVKSFEEVVSVVSATGVESGTETFSNALILCARKIVSFFKNTEPVPSNQLNP